MTDKEKKSKIGDILLDFYDEYNSNEINRPMIPSVYAGKILEFLQEEPVSGDLNEAARGYLLNEHLSPLNDILHKCDLKTEMQYHEDIEKAFKAGTEWKENQITKVYLNGYVARDKDESLHLFEVEPKRIKNEHKWWDRDYLSFSLDNEVFSDIKWEDAPQKAKIIIIKQE